jgi:S-adenosylmethionine hydrolase
MPESSERLIFTFTDFGPGGPYLAQMEAAVLAEAPSARVLHLLSDAPRFDPKRASYLLAALLRELPERAVMLAVVDPGVGGDRLPLYIELDGRVLVGPDNGLFAPAAGQARRSRAYRIDWRPQRLSASFHGRDLFAPVAARLARGLEVASAPLDGSMLVGAGAPSDLFEVVYLDHYGNAFTGIRGSQVKDDRRLVINGQVVSHARNFSASSHEIFWYRNSCGLVEIAAREQAAAARLGLEVGAEVALLAG